MNLTLLHARAIIEMDDHVWSEGLGPSDDYHQAWNELVQAAEEMTGTKTDNRKYREWCANGCP